MIQGPVGHLRPTAGEGAEANGRGNKKSSRDIWSHAGPEGAPPAAIEGIERPFALIGGHRSIAGPRSGSPDVTFPVEK